MKKRNKTLMIIVACVCSLLIIGGVYSYLTSQDGIVNGFAMGTVDISIEEEFTPPTNWEGTPTPKVVQIQNHGTQQTLIRVALIPRWLNADGSPFPGDTSRVTLELAENALTSWLKGDDGFYYYDGTVASGAMTEPLLSNVAFDTTEMDQLVLERYKDKQLIVEVRAEAVHALQEAYEASWSPLASSGSTIDLRMREIIKTGQ